MEEAGCAKGPGGDRYADVTVRIFFFFFFFLIVVVFTTRICSHSSRHRRRNRFSLSLRHSGVAFCTPILVPCSLTLIFLVLALIFFRGLGVRGDVSEP